MYEKTCPNCGFTEQLLKSKGVRTCPDCNGKLEYSIKNNIKEKIKFENPYINLVVGIAIILLVVFIFSLLLNSYQEESIEVAISKQHGIAVYGIGQTFAFVGYSFWLSVLLYLGILVSFKHKIKKDSWLSLRRILDFLGICGTLFILLSLIHRCIYFA